MLHLLLVGLERYCGKIYLKTYNKEAVLGLNNLLTYALLILGIRIS